MNPLKCLPSTGQMSIRKVLGFFAFLLVAIDSVRATLHTGQPISVIPNYSFPK